MGDLTIKRNSLLLVLANPVSAQAPGELVHLSRSCDCPGVIGTFEGSIGANLIGAAVRSGGWESVSETRKVALGLARGPFGRFSMAGTLRF